MQAAFYERTGPAREVLQVAELPDPQPGPGELRVRLRWSGVNPSDVKSRAGAAQQGAGRSRASCRTATAWASSTRSATACRPHASASGSGSGTPPGAAPSAPRRSTSCCRRRRPCRCPSNVADEAGACLGIPALTALHAVLTGGGVQPASACWWPAAPARWATTRCSSRGCSGAAQVLATASTPQKAADRARSRRRRGDRLPRSPTPPRSVRAATQRPGRGPHHRARHRRQRRARPGDRCARAATWWSTAAARRRSSCPSSR